MSRFIICNRISGTFGKKTRLLGSLSQGLKLESERAENEMHCQLDCLEKDFDVLCDTGRAKGSGRRMLTVQGDEADVLKKQLEWGADVIAEAEMQRFSAVAFRPVIGATSLNQLGTGGLFWTVLRGSGAPVIGASVSVVFVSRTSPGVTVTGNAITDAAGTASVAYHPALWWPAELTVMPHDSCWSYVGTSPVSGQVIHLPPLPVEGAVGWWHRVMGISDYQQTRGSGIRIGVADTGVGPHPFLTHVTDGGSCIGGSINPAGGRDVESHGTHVCGILGARPATASREYAGIAPGAEIVSVRIFEKASARASAHPVSTTNGDLANAVDELAQAHQVDIINLSLGGESPSLIEQDAIQAALEAGTLVIAAAGNSGGPVIYPGAYPQSVAISAVGIPNSAPPNSVDGMSMPNPQLAPDRFSGPVFLASFSNFGPAVGAAGPGVAIISTVPAIRGGAPYAAMSGTSMASPMVCAALAVLLFEDAVYKQMPRGPQRALRAWQVLTQNLQSLPGLAPVYVGGGLASASN